MWKIQFIKLNAEMVYLTGEWYTKTEAFDVAKSIAKNSMLKYENGDLLIVKRESFLKKIFR
jgi:hypothetical protein